jgi:PPM family protein phosphatase
MQRLDQNPLQIASLSHPGMSGKNNEDRYLLNVYQPGQTNKPPVVLAVLSDGIGGHRSGEVAAQLAVDKITEVVEKSNGKNPLKTMLLATQEANDVIYTEAQNDPDKRGMGATCAIAWIAGNRLYTTCIGDSRIYLLRGEGIRQLSIDHTWIQEALDTGTITPDQVAGHPNAHVIRRYLGSPIVPKADQRIPLRKGETDDQEEANQGIYLKTDDVVLLCSDGLSDLVSKAEMVNILHESPDLETAVQALVDRANDLGGHDNITVITMKIPAEVAEYTSKETTEVRWPILVGVGCLGLIVIAILGALVFFGVDFYLKNRGVLPPGNAPAQIRGWLEWVRMG